MRLLMVAALVAAAPASAQDAGPPNPSPGETGQELAEHFHGGRTLTFTQMEVDYSQQSGKDVLNWEGQGWIGNDQDKFWWKTEGETDGPRLDQAEVQMLYSRNLWSFFDLQGGVRFDAAPDRRGYVAVGIQGLAPYLLETELHAFIGLEGDVSLRLRQTFDLMLTNRIVLQPLLETDFYLTDVPARLIGTGFSIIETGVQARYEISRKFAPTLAVVYESRLGKSARLAQAEGKDTGGWSVRGGVRIWF